MFKMLDGFKTYIIAVAMLGYFGGGLVLHYMGSELGIEPKAALEGIMIALGLLGLRHSVAKVETKVEAPKS